jgi:hypothetical protein
MKKLSFNQKVAVAGIVIGAIIGAFSALPNWLLYHETKKERVKADEAKSATENLAIETADMVVLMTTYTGWGINSVPDFPARNKFYETTLSS